MGWLQGWLDWCGPGHGQVVGPCERKLTSQFHKMWEIFWRADKVLDSQVWLCFMKVVGGSESSWHRVLGLFVRCHYKHTYRVCEERRKWRHSADMNWRLFLFTWTHLCLLSEYFFHLSDSNSIYLLWRKGGPNAPTPSYSFHFLRRDYLFLKSAHDLRKYDACPHILSPSDKLGRDLVKSRVNAIFSFRDGKDLRCLLGCSARKIAAWIPKQILQYKAKESWVKEDFQKL